MFSRRGRGAERRELPASWPGLRPRLFLPVREFRWARGQRHLPGLWWSATTGSHVGYESWLERDHVMLLDFDPQVAAIAAQPFWLRWRDDAGRSRRHAPDLFARMADGSGVVIDVRPDDRIEQRDAEAFEATRSACGLAGWGFRRMGVPDPVLVANVAWLARYRHPRCGSPGPGPAAAEGLRRAGPADGRGGRGRRSDGGPAGPVPPDVAARAGRGPGRQADRGDASSASAAASGGAR